MKGSLAVQLLLPNKKDCMYDVETCGGSEDRGVGYHCHSQNAAQEAREEIERVLLSKKVQLDKSLGV